MATKRILSEVLCPLGHNFQTAAAIMGMMYGRAPLSVACFTTSYHVSDGIRYPMVRFLPIAPLGLDAEQVDAVYAQLVENFMEDTAK